MGKTVPFRCPRCGSEKFVKKAGAKPNDPGPARSAADFSPRRDVRAQGTKTAEKMLAT
jgi:hypothetical protein